MANAERSDDTENPRRRERAAIAAQACQTCRTRKSKCDENRPKCSLCERLGLDCQYREPLPTKKDKTMVQILEALNRLETKVDHLQPKRDFPQGDGMMTRACSAISRAPPALTSQPSASLEHLAAAHRVIVWPTIYLHLVTCNIPAASDLPYIVETGSSWLIDQAAKRPQPLDVTATLNALPISSRANSRSSRVTFPDLTIQQVQNYTEAYFHTFNVLNPLLDVDQFTNDVVSPLLREGYGYGDTHSVLALLVFALGQLAQQGILDQPIGKSEIGQLSGIRGGTIVNPPGLEIFNEARRRIAFVSSEHSIQAVQCQLLQATYYAANAMQLEFWQSSIAASTVCQTLLRRQKLNWSAMDSEPLKRAYWVCFMNESICKTELCLPGTGIQSLQSTVPLPLHSADSIASAAWASDTGRSMHEHYFNALCNLERLIGEIYTTIVEPAAEQSATKAPFHGPPFPLVREMARQLESWRSLLPRPLLWLDQEMYNFPNTDYTTRAPQEALFMVDQGAVPIRHRYNLDIATAWLRSRFYFAKFLMYQPFVYKALHFPELLGQDDVDCAAMAIRSACGWPIAMAPPKDKKRLIPFLFSWTHTFVSILLILHIARVHPSLKSICDEQVDPQQIHKTVLLLLEWLDDVRQWDGVAAWSWRFIEPLFRGA